MASKPSVKWYQSKRVWTGISTLVAIGAGAAGATDVQTSQILTALSTAAQMYLSITSDRSIDW